MHDFDQIISRYHTYCTQWDFIEDRFGKKNLLPFSISDSDFKVPERMQEVLHETVSHGIFGYTRWNHDDFKQAIAHHFQSWFQCEIDKEDIVYSPSVMYTLSKLIQLFSEKGDQILVFDPMYDGFRHVLSSLGSTIVPLAVSIERRFDHTDFEHKMRHSKVLLMCSPNNPNGVVYSRDEVTYIVEIAKKYQIPIICDEIHMDIVLFGNRFVSMTDYISQYKNIFVLSSASKTFNLAGLIGSYAILPDENVKTYFLHCIKETEGLNSISVMYLKSLICAYTECDSYIEELKKYIEGNMLWAQAFFKEYMPYVKFTLPQGTYLAWFDVSDLHRSAKEVQDRLTHIGNVAIMDGNNYSFFHNCCLRMNLACPREKMKEGLNRLMTALQ